MLVHRLPKRKINRWFRNIRHMFAKRMPNVLILPNYLFFLIILSPDNGSWVIDIPTTSPHNDALFFQV